MSAMSGPVYAIAGNFFREIGAGSAGGENPLYVLRVMPVRLRRLDNRPAFAEYDWQQGFVDQMVDSRLVAMAWAGAAR